MRIAVLRCERLPRFVTWEIPDVESLFRDDRAVIDAFGERGVDAEPLAWTDPDAAWDTYDAAVLRSTWDYVDDARRFLDVTAMIDRSRCTLLNPLDAVSWNADKRYLDDLDRLGVPIVPLVRGTRADAVRIQASITQAGWDELVLKPAVGVGGSGVVRTNAASLPHVLEAMTPDTEVMVQPFVDAVLDEGELSFIFIGGALSHVLRKRPARGDFRAHGIYGGTVVAAAAPGDDLAQLEAIFARLPFDLLYARIDVVRVNGRLAVLELELIEPMLYFHLAPGSAGRLADATITRLGRA